MRNFFRSKKKQVKKFNPEIVEIRGCDLFNQLVSLKIDPDIIDMRYDDYPYLLPIDPYFIMSAVPSFLYNYDNKTFNCNDFMKYFRGWLSGKKLGRLVAMEIGIEKKDGNQHLLVGFLHKNELIFGEPQSGIMTRLPAGAKLKHIII